jgi:hypothetical protein
MPAIVDRLYPVLSKMGGRAKEKAMTSVGISDRVSNTPPDKSTKTKEGVHYALYQGHCLDPENLSYFIPEKTVEEGFLTLEEVREILRK